MIVVLEAGADADAVRDIVSRARRAGLRTVADDPAKPRRLALVGPTPDPGGVLADELESLTAVSSVIREAGPAPLASRHFRPEPAPVRVGSLRIGGGDPPVLAAGPCAVESRQQLLAVARAAAHAGASLLRGGAFKPRTSPYAFQGLGPEALRLLAEARAETGLPVVTEVLAPELVELVAEVADMLQIGARNMQNYPLLAAAGASGRPVLLKRASGATLEEWLLAAEHLLASGAPGVVLCERGLRHFDPHTRNILDLAGSLAVRELTHLPVFIDPSHATGRRDLVMPLALAGLAAGLDGVIVEVHPDPDAALSDGAQSLDLDALAGLAQAVRRIGVPLATLDHDVPSASGSPGWVRAG